MSIREGRRAAIRRAPATGASSAFGWSLLNTVVSRLGTLGIGIVLARVLGPESFGTFAVALVALLALLSFNELGVSLAIVRWPGDPARIAPAVTTISIVSSAAFSAAAFAAAPAFTTAMGDPEATGVVRLLIINVLINGIVATPAALLQRSFREKTRMAIDQVNVWTGAVISLGLALLGMGAMALALGRVIGSLLSGVLFIAASPLPIRLGLDREHFGALIRFGLPLAGTSVVVFAAGNADQLAAGATLGTTALGFYVLAFNLSSWPVSIISQPLRRVAPAAFARLQDKPAAMQSALSSMMAVLASATFPAFMFLAGTAVPIISFVYGDVWLAAASALSWLVIAALSRLLCELAYDYLVVLGRSGTVFMVQTVSLLILVPALLIGSSLQGLAGLAAAQAAVSGLIVFPLYLWQVKRTGIELRSVLVQLALPAAVGIGCGAGAWFLSVNVASAPMAILIGGLLALSASAALLYRHREHIRELMKIGSTRAEEAV